ncbi:MAG TPA: isoprenylcysteine carboxylmethyltransferase family protein [Terriglobales bacterium]|jgi:protein-S-isoprenylcysteine O-methyltransferase Ste14|nr:isoprenylcysteine carboxylmethyltransferase family protein [Terriglobales bacterium]
METMRICSCLWTAFVVVWLAAWFKTKRTQERMNFGSRLLYSIPVFIGCYLLFGERFSGWLQERVIPKNIGIESVAILLTAVGIALAIWARFYIGENWSSAVSIKVDHQLIRTGPYAWVRHPIYSGILLGMIGTALARREPRGFFAIIFLWLGFWIKLRMEEGFMRKTFGEQYQEYSRSTGALTPKMRS